MNLKIPFFPFFRRRSRTHLNRKKMTQLLPSWEGRFCIYWEREVIAYGRVVEIRDSGEEIAVDLILQGAEGLPAAAEITLTSARDDLSASAGHLFTAFGGWHLFFQEDLVGRILDTARAAAGLPAEQRFLAVMDVILRFVEV